MVVILIRRFARPDREAAFLALFASQAPVGNPDFLGETLTRITGGAELPPEVPRLVERDRDSIDFLNVARWRSWESFARQFAPQLTAPGGFDPEIETRRAEIVVLDVVGSASVG